MGQWAERCLTEEKKQGMVEREELKESKDWEQGKGNKKWKIEFRGFGGGRG
jgi:hypothetical protein